MKIFTETKLLAIKERKYTTKLLQKLKIIERDKLFADIKYPSLHKYLMKELNYSEAESTIRVNAVRLMLKSKNAEKEIVNGKLSLTNAAEANKALGKIKDKSPEKIDEVVGKAANNSTREFKHQIQDELNIERREVLVLPEFILKQFDKMREQHGDLSTFELVQILLEKELNVPVAKQRVRTVSGRKTRHIAKVVKEQVYTGKCRNCGQKHGLEYDHKTKFSHGGVNSADNIQILCRNCNQRKEIKARQTNFFG